MKLVVGISQKSPVVDVTRLGIEVHVWRLDKTRVENQESRSSIDRAIMLKRLHKFPAFAKGGGSMSGFACGLSDYRARGSQNERPRA